MNKLVLIAMLGVLVLLTVACTSATTETKSSPTPVIPMATQAPPPNAPKATELPIAEVELPAPRQRIWPGLASRSVSFRFVDPPPLDWQILDADVIVVANFVSATAGVDTYEGPPAAYLPMHTLQFRATQYLKGTGPTQFTVEVLDCGPHTPPAGYPNREYALDLARSSLTARNAEWDSRPGVLFLNGPLAAVGGVSTESSSRSPQSEPAGVFHLTNNDLLNQSAFQYTVDTLSRDWLPASEATSSDSRSTDSDYIIDGSKTPPPTIALSALRNRISEIDTLLNNGDDSEAFRTCIDRSLRSPYHTRNWEPLVFKTGQLASGSPAGTQFGIRELGSVLPPGGRYEDFEIYLTGDHSDQFNSTITDDDSEPRNGFTYHFKAIRPLVTGQYQLHEHYQLWSEKPCNHRSAHDDPGYSVWDVTVTAPAGTLHEAFFDPVTVDTAVKADSSNGVLKPTSFTVDGISTEITSLEWNNNQVVLTLDPHVSLSGYVLDFIALDGSVSLSLFTDSATVDSTAGTYSWSMSSQPWENGDQLMLRIREDG